MSGFVVGSVVGGGVVYVSLVCSGCLLLVVYV